MDFVVATVVLLIKVLVGLFSQRPERENETVSDISEHHTRESSVTGIDEEMDESEGMVRNRRVRNWRAAADGRTGVSRMGGRGSLEEEREKREREADERARVLGAESMDRLRKRLREREEKERKAKEDLERGAAERVEEQQREKEEREQRAEERMTALEIQEMERRVGQQRAREREEILNDQKRLAEKEKRIAERELELEKWVEQARERISEEQESAAAMGFQPIQWPTADELDAAKQRVQYNPQNFHFAIVGKAGCGKSSLINSFLNLKSTDPGAAPTGTNETTLEVGRYSDPGTQPPRPWTVWYDIPGAGTQRITHWQYFTNQALFVFDIIILAIGERFEETDCQNIRSCMEFKIPFFIVRSKADQSIKNVMSDADEDYKGPFDSGEFYQKCRQSFIESSQKSVSAELDRAGLPDQVVYCVSKLALRDVYNSSLKASIQPGDDRHELALVKQLMLAAYLRRSGGDNRSASTGPSVRQISTGWAQSAFSAAGGIAESTIGLGLNALGVTNSNNVHQKQQPNREQNSWAKRVIYVPRRTTVPELLSELDACNPGISTTFAARPRIMGSKAALLCFHSTASIPSNILSFGENQKPTMYKEKAPTRRAPPKASSISTSADTPPTIYTPPGSSFSGSGQWGPRR